MRPLAIRERVHLRRRRGFTLVELLVVIAIISVLVGLSIGAVMATIGYQHQKNTTFMMTQLNGALNKHWTAVSQAATTENWNTPDNAVALAQIRAMAGGDDKRARVMYVKFREKQEFPTTFDEALNPAPLLPKPTYGVYLKKFGITGSSVATLPYESSACLYMAMALATSGTKFNADQFGGAVRELDAPNGKIKYFADDWGKPLVFARWPYLDPNLPSLCPIQNSVMRDKDDPDGRLIDSTWSNTAGRAAFEKVGHPVTKGSPPQPYAYYLLPTIVSGGRDNNLGINAIDYPTLYVSNPGLALDNIYSYTLDRN